MLSRTDNSDLANEQIVTYKYDQLNRLSSAATTIAGAIPTYTQNFSYDALGNLLTGPAGTYLYQGNTGSSFANPDAVTSLVNSATTTFSYDNNGNLTAVGTTTFYTYDYKNELASSGNGHATTTYAYDPSGNRVSQSIASTTTSYPSKFYTVTTTGTAATTSDYIFNGDNLLSTLDTPPGGGGSTNSGLLTAGTVNAAGTWTSLTVSQIATANSAYASCFGSCANPAQVSNFGFNIPSGATINGIGVTVTYNCSSICTSGRYAGLGVALSWNNGTTYTSAKTATTTSTTNVAQTLGGSADTWGRTWAYGDFASTTFKMQLTGANSQGTVNLDQLQIQVYYTTSGGTSTSTIIRYIHPDNLGSTNVTSDSSGNVVQVLDYYPYGATRINNTTGGYDSQRKWIGQYADSDGLNYLNARYEDPQRGQFLSEDPLFLGNPKQQNLQDPQSLNSYSYAGDNPITRSDPTGLWYQEFLTGHQSWPSFYGELGDAANQLGQQSSGWNFAFNHPYTTGAVVGVGSIPALYSGVEAGGAAYAAGLATYLGGGASFIAQQSFAALVYSVLTGGAISGNLGTVNQFSQTNPNQPTSILGTAGSLVWNVGPSLIGGYTGSTLDAIQFGGMVGQALGSAATNLFSNSVQTRTSAVNQFNASLGSGSTGGGGGSQPSNSSLWVTPSGAVINWGGQLVSGPPSTSKK